MGGASLQACVYERDIKEPPPGWDTFCQGGTLSIEGLRSCASLQQLLGCLVPQTAPPAGGSAFRSLLLRDCELDAGAVQHCARLAPLAELDMVGCRHPSSEDGLAALLPQMPQLTALILRTCRFRSPGLPPCVVSLTGLRSLELSGMVLSDLPAGPYLTGGRCMSPPPKPERKDTSFWS